MVLDLLKVFYRLSYSKEQESTKEKSFVNIVFSFHFVFTWFINDFEKEMFVELKKNSLFELVFVFVQNDSFRSMDDDQIIVNGVKIQTLMSKRLTGTRIRK